jgi:hypothetical protein
VERVEGHEGHARGKAHEERMSQREKEGISGDGSTGDLSRAQGSRRRCTPSLNEQIGN